MFQEGDVVLAVGEESVLHRPLDWVKSRILGKPGVCLCVYVGLCLYLCLCVYLNM